MPQLYDVPVTLPAIPADEPDVIVTRRLRVSVDGAPFVTIDVPAATTTHVLSGVPENAVVDVTHALVDDAGLEGPPSPVASKTVGDTTPPLVTAPVVIGEFTPVPTLPSPPPPTVPTGRRLLRQSDFTLAAFYVLGGHDHNYGSGLTVKDGNLLTLDFAGNILPPGPQWLLTEYALPAESGQYLQQVRRWPDIWEGTLHGAGLFNGIHYHKASDRLFHSGALYYPQEPISQVATTCISARRINQDGTVRDRTGYAGLENIGQRALWSGAMRSVPQWFRSLTGVGPHVCGFGATTSLIAQGLHPSLGPLFVFTDLDTGMTAPEWGRDEPTIPESGYRIGADCRSGVSGQDWYANGYAHRTFDRGVRLTIPLNYYEGGDSRSNPSTPPDAPPLATGAWLSPAPDGKGRWTWNDGYVGMDWIDNDAGTRPTHGMVCVLNAGGGRNYYMGSAGYKDWPVCEIHIYNPARVAECLAGQRQPWDVQPDEMFEVRLPNLAADLTAWGGATISASAVCPDTNRLFVRYNGAGIHPSLYGYVAVFQLPE